GKCGGFGASALVAGIARAPVVSASVSKPASTILPRPTPHSPRKWRRVTCWQWAWMGFMASALGDGFFEVHNRASERGPRGRFMHVARFGADERLRVEFTEIEARALRVEKLRQPLHLVLRRRSRKTA